MLTILEQYYQFFNAGNYAGMLGLLSDEVMHEPCQGSARHGKEKFAEFLRHMERCYKEQVHNPVFMVSADGKNAAVEFFLPASISSPTQSCHLHKVNNTN